MSRKTAMSLLVVLLSFLLLTSRPALCSSIGVAVSCPVVQTNLAPCLSFVSSKSDKPDGSCCSGVKNINSSAKTKDDRKAVCECIKDGLKGVKYEPKRIPEIPKKCGLPINLPPIASDTNCATWYSNMNHAMDMVLPERE
ncbi:hypothetical protein K2173_025308 [Erythroxylum novogranatense]|uniref:Non-specific lipid-transfer protein n=1 Tax=Erythroxylum novogranatense TaxID=1862640 RepID=A0AAV8UDN5_9ROSI|nr:hypothetical protein K2173_025308 [Erythroxylum novogranatense]